MQWVVLAAIAVAGAVIAVDTLRQRAAAKRRPHAGRALAAALARPATNPPVTDLVRDRLASPADVPDEGLGGIWDDLVDRVDPDAFLPKLADGTEIAVFRLRGGNDYAVCARSDRKLHYYLEPWEAELMRLMDGTRTTPGLIVAHLAEAGDLDPGAVLSLVVSLHEGGFLDPAPIDMPATLRDHLDPASPGRRKIRGFLRSLRIAWDGADGFVRACYRGGLRSAFLPPVTIALGLVALGGLVAFGVVFFSGRYTISGAEAPAEAILLLALGFVLTFAHELGHALVLTHYGRRVISAGFFIFFGSPAFFVDSSDGLMLDRRQRMVQSFGGPFAELVLAGIASLILIAWPEASISGFLYRFAVLNYFLIVLNLIPLLELDGYWILSDLIQVRDLRPRSLAFIQGDLWHKIRARERFSRQEAGLALYGTVGLLFTVFSFWTAALFWQHIFGGIVTGLWNGGVASRILLVVLASFFAGPAIRGLIAMVRATVRRLHALADRIRFARQRSWRVEAAELIDALPAFEDLPEDVLSDLAGRVRLRTFPPDHAVFRQGDRPDAFYVIRRGQVAVEDAHPDTGDIRVIRTLGRGESFGELGLLEGARRRATIRAMGDVQLFAVDKPTFDRLLADDIAAPDFAPTMQELAELRGLPVFRTLALDDLDDILEHGEWVNAAPGEIFVEQGEPGDAFYAIASGQTDVIRDDELLVTLGPGDHFGEVALLEDVPRTATVAARTAVRAFRLDAEGFDLIVARSFRSDRPDRAPDRDMEH